jgi:hypothetical protein
MPDLPGGLGEERGEASDVLDEVQVEADPEQQEDRECDQEEGASLATHRASLGWRHPTIDLS